jgi:hypothetical protein
MPGEDDPALTKRLHGNAEKLKKEKKEELRNET